ncbi:Vinorine synthase-like [Quillaja saponaria]|uniref:Vinorine synthase-like n=1 Tax=Quillaja saponaria TaxID=32244 RepID=A0AAD7PC08_QUISA|nr:Vinorine synthase-like [Quillaja saponaria]
MLSPSALFSVVGLQRLVGTKETLVPKFFGASFLPPGDVPTILTNEVYTRAQTCSTRRSVFNASKIANAIGPIQQQLSSEDIALSIILRCAMAARRSVTGFSRPSLFLKVTNLRMRMNPPLPENAVGNLFWLTSVFLKESEIELYDLVLKMRHALVEFCNENVNKLKGDEGSALVTEPLKESEDVLKTNPDIFRCTSLRQFPLYEMDFGWGKPIWATSPIYIENVIVLADTRLGDGIEAWVTFEKEVMAIFECDQELLVLLLSTAVLLSITAGSEH